LAKKPEIQKRLWDLSCQLTGWTDIPISDVVKQTLATRRAKLPETTEVEISNEVAPNITQPRKSETDSIKRALEPLKFIDDMEYIDEEDVPETPENSPPRSSSSSTSSNASSEKGHSRSSVSSKSSTGTVIAGTPVQDHTILTNLDSSELDRGSSTEMESHPTDLKISEQILVSEDIGNFPNEFKEPLSSLEHEGLEEANVEQDSSLIGTSFKVILPLTLEEEGTELRSVSVSYDHESTTSSFTYESTSANTFNDTVDNLSSSSEIDSTMPVQIDH